MGTIAQLASQSTIDIILQLASQITMKLLPDQPVSLQWLSFFSIRPASWSTMDLLMDWPVYLQWV